MKEAVLSLLLMVVGLIVHALPTDARQNSSTARIDPATVILLPENEHAILVEKHTQRFYIYRADSGTRDLEIVFATACSTGEATGPKMVEGDKKTPEGVYFMTDEHEEKDLTPVYGKRAFPIDYPNFMDRSLGKTGYAIWIHGTDKVLKPMDTNGCIALENDDMAALSGYINLHATPLIIQEKMVYASPADLAEKRETVLSFVKNWAQAHLGTAIHQYLSFYAPSYQPDIRWWQVWQVFRDPGASTRILTPGIGIYQHGEMLVVLMDFVVAVGDREYLLGKRRLFVQQDEAKNLKIVGDLFQVLNKPYDTSEQPLEAVVLQLRQSVVHSGRTN